jgi:hypothetical protein
MRKADLFPGCGLWNLQIGTWDDLLGEDHLAEKPVFIDWKAVVWGQRDWEMIAVKS